MMNAVALLLALLVFQVKHLICDFIIQTPYQFLNKGFYGRLGGLVHAGLHIAFSIPALLILTRDVRLIAVLLLLEFLVHYHTDWLKARTQRLRGWSQNDTVYWMAFGADQFVHQVTYIAMIGIILGAH